MAEISNGKTPNDWWDRVSARNAAAQAQALDAARNKAHAAGKQPFDFAQVIGRVDFTTPEGHTPDPGVLRRDLEAQYYLHFPEGKTLDEFVRELELRRLHGP